MAEDSYSAIVLDHFANPRNAGVLREANAVGVTTNPVCGDTMKLMLRVDGEVITAARWQTVGCPAAIATSSIASEMIIGKQISEAEALTRDTIAAAAGGLPASKLHCSVLAHEALRKALKAYRASGA